LELNVDQCLARVRKNDQDAARSLVDHLYPAVIRIVRAHLPRAVAEEDLAQDIFLKVFDKLEQYQGEVPLAHWVSRIAVNHCLNALRSQKVRPEWRMADLSEEQEQALAAVTAPIDLEPHPSQLMAARELVDILMAALRPADRIVIQMLEIEDRSIEEVRQLTGWPEPLIRVRAFRARHKMNKYFRKLTRERRL
jgi:RNA polymerase sigma factor (sigma-70 family)